MANPINSVFTDDDRAHMRAALSLAKRAIGTVAPNPAVGCVLFRPDLGADGRVVGRGFTQPGGRPHAETEAIHQAGDLASSAHAYVTLEPCNHQGQTGPCTEALIDAGISGVTVALTDPDPRVQGSGINRLKDAGLDVRIGLLEDEARTINAGFLSIQERRRPWVTLKVATSADGMIAAEKGVPLWITGSAARARGHLIRSQNDAILTGVGTVVADNPQMTCRLPGLEHRSPRRYVIDPQARMSPDAEILKPVNGHQTVVFTGAETADRRVGGQAEANPQPLVDGRFDISRLLEIIAMRGITRLMVEGGQGINDAFLSAGLIDEIAWFRAKTDIGASGVSAFSHGTPDNSPDFQCVSTIDLDGDRLERYLRVV
jgi:diaminohydroxyphosphoribosylaminopyrimidine deaminase/5-amino-6-(5-phosphoribosylamino)uracil reductase